MLNPESRFLREIPQELMDWRRTEQAGLSLSAPVSRAGRFGGSARPAPASRAAEQTAAGAREPGDRVTHDKYGLGRVEEVSGVGESAMSLIDFGSSGRVKLMHNHAPVAEVVVSRRVQGDAPPPGRRQQRQHRVGHRQGRNDVNPGWQTPRRR